MKKCEKCFFFEETSVALLLYAIFDKMSIHFWNIALSFRNKKVPRSFENGTVEYTFLARVGTPNTHLNGFCTRYRYSPTRTISIEMRIYKKSFKLECHLYYKQFFAKCQYISLNITVPFISNNYPPLVKIGSIRYTKKA